MTDDIPREVTDADVQVVNAHFRCPHVGDVMLEKGYWKKNNVERNEAKC